MQGTPYDKCPGCTMPQSAQKKHDPNIADQSREAPSVAAKRYIDIILEPGRKRNMPSAPKIDETGRQIWSIEVDHEFKAE